MSTAPLKPPIPIPLPPLRKASFANLARLFRLGVGVTTSEADIDKQLDTTDDDDADASGGDGANAEDQDADEESLMWDAQAALIAHQPELAIERYTTAALPPHRSAAACLALGNLLTRGTAFTQPASTPSVETHPAQRSVSRKGKEKAPEYDSMHAQPSSPPFSPISPPAFSRFLGTFFGNSSRTPPDIAPPPMTSPVDRKYDLVGNGWAMRKEGKRAVRDVEGMGIAAGWLVLGLGWIVEGELNRRVAPTRSQEFRQAINVPNHVMEMPLKDDHSPEDDVVMIGSKKKGAPLRLRIDTHGSERGDDQLTNPSTIASPHPSTTDCSSATHTLATQTSDTVDSIVLETPHSDITIPTRDFAAEIQTLKLIYDLLQPLLHLYRHGHIQAGDPVFLPPITSTQLPSVLRPAGDLQKRRNAWALGAVVVGKLSQIEALQASEGLEQGVSKERIVSDWRQLACGVRAIANYILGMTSDKHLRENYFRAIIEIGPCGLNLADDVVRQAAKRLDLINQTPSEPPTPLHPQDGYPFPQMSLLKPPSRKRRNSRRSRRQASGTHRVQNEETSGRQVYSPPRRQKSLDSDEVVPVTVPAPTQPSATSVSNGTAFGYSSSVHDTSPVNRPSALDSLRQVSETSVSHRHQRKASNASILSILSPSPERSLKSLPSVPCAMVDGVQPVGHDLCAPKGSATETLKRMRSSYSDMGQTQDDVRWPSLSGYKMATSPPPSTAPEPISPPLESIATHEVPSAKRKNAETVRAMASSPNLPSFRTTLSPPGKQHRSVSSVSRMDSRSASSASLLGGDVEIAQIDPSLAAAELASALTKHVCCSVCAVKGVNFPECRKCGMRFCSRECRVGEQGAGDGKRHLCGVWKTRLARAKEAGSRVDKSGVPVMTVSFAESLGKTPTPPAGLGIQAC